MNAPEPKSNFKVVGTRPIRPDGADKVTGRAIYGPDFKAPNMLFGAIVRSPHPHARIRSIDTRRAEAVPGVHAVVTGADFPPAEDIMVSLGEGAGNLVDMSRNVMALETAFYDGHAIAAVAATSQAAADEAASQVEVEFEILPHVISINEAIAADAPKLHPEKKPTGMGEGEVWPPNVLKKMAISRGEAAAGLAGAQAVVSGHYSMPPVHQGYIEPHACVASWKSDGNVDIWCSTQGGFTVRELTASILQLEIGKIRVMPLEIGGGFGGKTTIYLEPVAVLLSKKAGRPVRLAMSRSDIFRASGPAPGAEIDVQLGADANGKIVGAQVTLTYSAGVFSSIEIFPGVITAISHYNIDNYKVTGWEVLCNMPKHNSYRAPGAPQVNFAVESALNELADKLEIDPLEIRLRNAIKPGDLSISGVPYREIGLVECLEAAKAHPHYAAPLGPNQGRGVACGGWINIGGPSTAAVSIAEDGSVLVIEGNPDIGGSRAAMAIMASETLGVPYERIGVTIADTSSIGVSQGTGGSRTTFATGKAVIAACEDAMAKLRDRAAKMWGVDAAQVEWVDGHAVCTDPENAGKTLSIQEIAEKSNTTGGPINGEAAVNPSDHLPAYAVHICDVEVDPETGQVMVVRYTSVQDVGRAIHPSYVEGQMQGGAAQGIGWALNEAYIYARNGTLSNDGFLDYRMPVASDLPMLDTVMVEKPNPAHPFGVKGVGEVPIVPPLAAVGTAVGNVIGKRMRELPISPDRVHRAMYGGD